MEEKDIKDAEVSRESNVDGENSTQENAGKPKRNDYLAVIVLLAGLLVGSLFVDTAQLITAQGFSDSALRKGDVFERGGKTWVAYKDPAVKVYVITDKTCENCDPSEALLFLRQYVPTMIAHEADIATQEGKALAEKMQVKTLPAFAFDASVQETEFYTQASQILEQKENLYALNTQAMGMPAGKYLTLPEVGEDAIVLGNRDAEVRVIEYSDFECPYCKMMLPVVDQMLEEYGDQVAFVYKHLPLSFHAQAENAALASECANEQGKFREYHDLLFENQEVWSETTTTANFKQYARQLRLDGQQFNTCLDSKKYLDKVNADAMEAQSFGISGTPGFFVGEEFLGGAAQYPTIKEMIDRQLGSEGESAEAENAPAEETTEEEKEENKA